MNLNELRDTAHAMAISKGWYDKGDRNVGEQIALMHSELSEALEELRNGHAPTEIYESAGGKPEGVPIELADLLVRVFDLCGYLSIDIQAAVERKMAFNATRPIRHGKVF